MILNQFVGKKSTFNFKPTQDQILRNQNDLKFKKKLVKIPDFHHPLIWICFQNTTFRLLNASFCSFSESCGDAPIVFFLHFYT